MRAAKVIVDGKVAPNSRFDADLRNETSVIVRKGAEVQELYWVGLSPDGHRFVWKCQNFAFSFLPGLAFSPLVRCELNDEALTHIENAHQLVDLFGVRILFTTPFLQFRGVYIDVAGLRSTTPSLIASV